MNDSLVTFLEELMGQRQCLPSQLAADLGVSHATVSRWLSGKDKPSPQSCRSLAMYARIPVEKVFAIVGHLPPLDEGSPAGLPEIREYALQMYPYQLDDDTISMLEELIQIRRARQTAGDP